MRIGIIGPCEDEIVPFIERMSGVTTETHALLKFHAGTYANVNVVALFCGVCKVNAAIAAQVLIDRYDVTHMLVVGVAGAIDAKLRICDTVLSSEVAYHDVEEGILTGHHPWMPSVYFPAGGGLVEAIHRASTGDDSIMVGRMVTGESFIDQHGRKEIIEKHAPLCVDMETASVAHVCYANKIPFAAIRSMSDTPHESGNEAFEKYSKQAALKSIAVLKLYLEGMEA